MGLIAPTLQGCEGLEIGRAKYFLYVWYKVVARWIVLLFFYHHYYCFFYDYYYSFVMLSVSYPVFWTQFHYLSPRGLWWFWPLYPPYNPRAVPHFPCLALAHGVVAAVRITSGHFAHFPRGAWINSSGPQGAASGPQVCPFSEISEPHVGIASKLGQSDHHSPGPSGWSPGSPCVNLAHENPSLDFSDLQCEEGVSPDDLELEAQELTEAGWWSRWAGGRVWNQQQSDST